MFLIRELAAAGLASVWQRGAQRAGGGSDDLAGWEQAGFHAGTILTGGPLRAPCQASKAQAFCAIRLCGERCRRATAGKPASDRADLAATTPAFTKR